jgi:hypothetical protein
MGELDSSQQETMGKQFPVRHGAMMHHLNRKRLAKSFLSGMGLMRINSTGNDWRKVSCPACEQCVSTQQETFSEKFPVRHVSSGIQLNRKLFAKGFPSDMGAMVHHLNRKLFAKGFLSGMGLWCITSTGNDWWDVE